MIVKGNEHVPALRIEGLVKSFGPNTVLREVGLTVQPGEIRALLGMNGSGKSTLIKIISGYHLAESGSVNVAGTRRDVTSSSTTPTNVRFVHQDLGLVTNLSAADNMALAWGYPRRHGGLIAWSRARRDARRALVALGYDFDPARPVGSLTAAERAGTAIARALGGPGDAALLILDEPTAALPANETSRLFDAVRRLAEQGTAVLYVTHHLDEVFALAHRVSVLRNGAMVIDDEVSQHDHESLVEAMSGRELRPSMERSASAATPTSGTPALTISGLSTHRLRGIDLTARTGEIVGVAGITGSGREDFAAAVMGTLPRAGDVMVGDVVIPPDRPDRSVAAGMGCIPANRFEHALLPTMSVTENLTITDLRTFSRRGIVRRQPEQFTAQQAVQRLAVTPPAPSMPVGLLSGGNQQKVVLARWLALGTRPVIVLDEPTQGVDVEARVTIYRELREAKTTSAIVVSSSDSDELAAICDRVVVLRNGIVAAEFHTPLDAHEIEAAALSSTLARSAP